MYDDMPPEERYVNPDEDIRPTNLFLDIRSVRPALLSRQITGHA